MFVFACVFLFVFVFMFISVCDCMCICVCLCNCVCICMRGCSTGNTGQGLTVMCDSVAKESEYLGVRPLLGQLLPNANTNTNTNKNTD